MDDLIKALRATRPGYAEEHTWHKFLMDSYAGTGGFEGRIRQPFASYWGAAADVYSRGRVPNYTTAKDESEIDTYLDRFMREDLEKFSRRAATSQYPNYIEPIIDIRLSFMHRKEFVRRGAEVVSEFLENADGLGKSWEQLREEEVDPRAALLGWTPVLFDRTRPEGVEPGVEMSREQAAQLGIRVIAIPLYPGNLLDWDTDYRGQFTWAKLSTWETLRPDPLGPSQTVQTISIWERNRVRRWEIIRIEGDDEEMVRQVDDSTHDYGKIPLLIAKHKPAKDDPVKGCPMTSGPSRLARKLFNYLSELDEHIRSSVFAFLQVPVKGGGPDKGEISLGNTNALAIPMDSRRDLMYVAPPASVAETLESRVKNTVEEIYRTGRTEFARVQVEGRAESGTARIVAFENTNRAIADFANHVGNFDTEALRCVAVLEGRDPSSIQTIAPKRFDIEELSRELEEVMSAITIDIGPTAIGELKKRLIGKLLPHLQAEQREAIEGEIEALVLREQQSEAADLFVGEEEDEDDGEQEGAGEGGEAG